MTDQLLYRLNRVPDRLYVKFLELIGVRLFPPTAAQRRRDVLAVVAARTTTVHVADGHRGVDRRAPRPSRRSSFTTDARTCRSSRPGPDFVGSMHRRRRRCATTPPGMGLGVGVRLLRRDHRRSATRCYIGLDRAGAVDIAAAPVRLRGRRARHRPARPAAARGRRGTATAGRACDVERDATGGLNLPGDVELHLPRSHASSRSAAGRAGLAALPGRRAGRGPAGRTAPRPMILSRRRGTSAAPSRRSTPSRSTARSLGVSEGVAGQRVPGQPTVPVALHRRGPPPCSRCADAGTS